jgi:glucose-1-phosphate adenylyltransferase
MPKVVTLILAGGQGSRLYPLTKLRSKPAVPIAGRFRLIDFPLSNCLHSDLRKIFILTQFSSESLHRHIFLTYRFDNFSRDFVTILSAQQTLENRHWYQGTADAVRQNLKFIRHEGDLVLILSGDHLYRMDYNKFIRFHLEREADISISVYPVASDQAPQFGVMKADPQGRITDFCEKPQESSQLEAMAVRPETFEGFGLRPEGRTHLASMGIYLFKWGVLKELLLNTTHEDFGREVIPQAMERTKIFGYFFDGYWEDIGTIRSFFDAHMKLIQPQPRFNFYEEAKPIYSHPRFLPGSKILNAELCCTTVCEGSIINKSNISHSIVGIRSRIGEDTSIARTIIMGADSFESMDELERNKREGIPHMGIGRRCEIRNAILDKDVRIGDDVKLINADGVERKSGENFEIIDGITVIPKHAVIPSGTVI